MEHPEKGLLLSDKWNEPIRHAALWMIFKIIVLTEKEDKRGTYSRVTLSQNYENTNYNGKKLNDYLE